MVAFYTAWLKSGVLVLFAMEKVLGNFYIFINTFKPVQCVFQFDGKTLGCSSLLGYSYLGLIKCSRSQGPRQQL